ncbi:S-layer homology domain-containing protein [Paenibacillus taichungensis]|uniref:S-layer homology domain-containing protein n=1 Tax=Paenibacillus taichungensis TaxID=484184 RepID=UPI0037F1E662
MFYRKLISSLLVVLMVLQVVVAGGVAEAASTPLEQLNNIRNASGSYYDEDEAIAYVRELLEEEQVVLLPGEYESMNDNQKQEIAKGMVKFLPKEVQYETVPEAQYVFNVLYYLVSVPKEMEADYLQEKLNVLYGLLAELPNYYPDVTGEGWDELSTAGMAYGDLQGADKSIFTSIILFLNQVGIGLGSPIHYQGQLEYMLVEMNGYTAVNSSVDPLNMAMTLNNLYMTYDFIQIQSTSNTNVQPFVLDLGKMSTIENDTQRKNDLAQWMIDHKPLGGYSSVSEVQAEFDAFFDDETDPLAAVNAAKTNRDEHAMLLAIQSPALGIQFPALFNDFTEQQQLAVAKFLYKNMVKNYKNKDQVQYMIELAVQAQSIWDERSLAAITPKLEVFAQKLIQSPSYFNDNETYNVVAAGSKYLKFGDVDRTLFSFKFMYQMGLDINAGQLDSNNANGQYILQQIMLLPYTPIAEVTDINKMNQWLEDVMNDQLAGENFFAQNNSYNMTGNLNLRSRYDLDEIGKKELAEWVLNEQDGYEDVGNLQYVINRFFTAPNVTGNDINNTITGLDDTMEISLNGKQTWIDVASIQKFDFSGDKTVWVRYKAISDLLPGRAVKIVFTANGDSNNGNGSTPNTGGSTGGGSSVTTPVTTTPTTKQEQIVVDVNGANGTNLTKTPITRTTEADGTIKDFVKMSEAIAKESVEKAKQLNMNTARIVIPDAKDAVSETRIELPKAAVKQLNDGGLNLEISTENAIISVPTKSIAGFDQDLYFRVVPLKKESERKEVEERAKKEQLIQQITPNSNVKVLARPVEIETNMQSHEVTLTLPLRDSLPTDPAARQQALDNLAVYIEHSDGTKELIQGKLVKLSDSSEGIEFTVNKFSTFTLVVVDGLKASQGSHNPYINGFGADFRPDAFVTRAQMAAMLARNLSDEAGTASSNAVNYDDVSATHWAASDIQKAQSAGIMNGMNATQFAPEGSITRAQMATIAYRWIQQQSVDASSSTTQATDGAGFTDVSADLWAFDAIAYVQSAGLMTGYNDDTFKPNSKLTRAEAVKVLNVLFKRTPVTGVTTPSFIDVPATHWAFADIEAAAQK